MMYKTRFGGTMLTLFCTAAVSMAISAVASAQVQSNQKDRNQVRGNNQAHSNVVPQAHAQREIVRTPTFVQRPRPTQFPIRNMPVQRYQPPQQVTRPPIIYSQPVQPPVRQQPIYQAPLRRQPTYQAPVHQQPIYRAPVRQKPNPILNPPAAQSPLQRRAGNYTPPPRIPRATKAPNNLSQMIFTQTSSGRNYDNGVRLRKGTKVTSDWERRYFHRGHYHFPFYRPRYVRNITVISPFGFYYGVCAPYISSAECNIYPPVETFVDMPVYNGDNCVGFADNGDQNLLRDSNLDFEEPGLANAVDQIRATFQDGNINALVTLIDPNTSVAIYERGQYKYSMSGDNYLDLTRDAIKSAPTVQFYIDYLHQTSPTVFTASGRHIYRDPYGNQQTMYVSFGLQDISGQWTLTQVETSPARYQSLTP